MSVHFSRRKFLKIGGATLGGGLLLNKPLFGQEVEAGPSRFHVPLTDGTGLNIDGAHRFPTISGLQGFHASSLNTHATIRTSAHRQPRATMSFWFSPLEDMDFYTVRGGMDRAAPGAKYFPLISDVFPGRNIDAMKFGVYCNADYPQLVGKFAGGRFWGQLDFVLPAFVYAERLLLRRGCWYHVAITWDKPAEQLRMYVNGRRVGYFDAAKQFAEAPEELYLGNPMMVMRDLIIEGTVLDEQQIDNRYKEHRPATNDPADKDIHEAYDVIERPPLDLKRDDAWKEGYAASFNDQKQVDEWIFQTGDDLRAQHKVAATNEGLLISTPDVIHIESRMYLWSPRPFESDQWVEYDFRLESTSGLSLLVMCCRGPQRDDYFADRPLEKTGTMGTILSSTVNYHWEYLRRVEMMRRDLETQYVAKNPWLWRLHYGCIPRIEENRWYHLRFIKAGDRLHGSIDGNTIFDVRDNPSANNGPVLTFGRMGFRQMYKTTMRYRNLTVHERA